jgi:hypothetical protein
MIMKKGQVNMIALVLILVVFLVLFLFLSTGLKTQALTERLDFYTNNLLISLIKTDTGYTANPQYCRSMSDILHSSIFRQSLRCGSTLTARAEAQQLIELYLDKATEKSGFQYYFVWGTEGTKFEIGEKSLANEFSSRSTQIIEKEGNKVEMTLYVGRI